MKKSIISLCLLAVAANVSAQNVQVEDIQQLDQAMSNLVVVDGQVDMFADIHQDENYANIEYVVHEDYSEMYITHEQAKKSNLEKLKKFYVYGHEDLDVVMNKIAKHLDEDKPTYFTVDLYRNYLGDSGDFKFVAKVIEYK